MRDSRQPLTSTFPAHASGPSFKLKQVRVLLVLKQRCRCCVKDTVMTVRLNARQTVPQKERQREEKQEMPGSLGVQMNNIYLILLCIVRLYF